MAVLIDRFRRIQCSCFERTAEDDYQEECRREGDTSHGISQVHRTPQLVHLSLAQALRWIDVQDVLVDPSVALEANAKVSLLKTEKC